MGNASASFGEARNQGAQIMQLTGIHHVTAITAQAAQNRRFYVETLGLRLVKKTVNQDDTSAYHLFYADGAGSPGTDLTFFDWPAAPARRGTHSITRTSLRVASEASLDFWRDMTSATVTRLPPSISPTSLTRLRPRSCWRRSKTLAP